MFSLRSFGNAAFSIAVFLFTVLCGGSVYAAVIFEGDPSRGFEAVAVLAGCVVFTLTLVGGFRLAVARQRVRVPDAGRAFIVQTDRSSEFEGALERLGLLPVWRIRLVALRVEASQLTFWSDINKPFVFGAVPRSSILSVRVERVLGGLRPTSRLVFRIAHQGSIVELPVVPLDASGAVVFKGSAPFASEVERGVLKVLDEGES